MDLNTIVLVVILAVIIYAIVSHNQEKSTVAELSRQEIMAEKEELSKGGYRYLWPGSREEKTASKSHK